MLKAANRRLGLVETLTDCIADRRERGKVIHEMSELMGQRIYALACGYADCSDAARLGADPIHKALIGRDPVDGDDLWRESVSAVTGCVVNSSGQSASHCLKLTIPADSPPKRGSGP